MTGRRLLILLALAAIAVIAVITLTGHDDDPAGPPSSPGGPGDKPRVEPIVIDVDPADPPPDSGVPAPPEVVLSPAGDGPSSLLVTVLDVAGKPVAGAALRLLEFGRFETGDFSGAAEDQILMGIEVVDRGKAPPGKTGVTSGDGTFLYEGLDPGHYFVGALVAGHSPGEERAEVPQEGRVEVEVTVGPGAVLAGRVVDARGNPVAGARVLECGWRNMENLPYGSMELMASGADGSFRFTSAVPKERHILAARASDGRMAISARIRAPKEDVELRLNRRITLVGRVTDDVTGHPVAGAKIYVMLGSALSDEDGSYRLEGVVKSLLFRWVWIRKEGYEQKYHEVDLATSLFGGTEVEVDFTLTRIVPSRILVRARDIDGLPLAGVEVTATSANDEKVKVSGTTDKNGELELAAASPRSSYIMALKPGYVQVELQNRPDGDRLLAHLGPTWMSVDPGGEATVVVTLVRTASLRGIVRDAAGNPLEGVLLGGEIPDSATTGEDGRFELAELPGGVKSRIQIAKEGYVQSILSVDPAEEPEVEIVLHRGSTLSGHILDEAGNPVAKARASLRPADLEQELENVRTDRDGSFELSQLAEGRYVIEVHAKGFAPARSRVIEVGPGVAVTGVGIVLERGFLAEIRARTVDGEEARAQSFLHGPLERPEAERVDLARSGLGPKQHAYRVPQGRYRVVVLPGEGAEGAGAAEEVLEITADGEVPVTLGTTPRFITARLPAGKEVGSLHLTRTDPPAPRVRFWAPHDSGGVVSTPALPPGKYQVLVYFPADDGNTWVLRKFEGVKPGDPILEVEGD